jgi:hypothetical protein
MRSAGYDFPAENRLGDPVWARTFLGSAFQGANRKRHGVDRTAQDLNTLPGSLSERIMLHG